MAEENRIRQSLDALVDNIKLVVINVAGRNVNLLSETNTIGKWFDDSANRAKTLWNFHQVESVTFRTFTKGAILAPLTLVQTKQVIEGSTYVHSLSTESEIHRPLLDFPECI